ASARDLCRPRSRRREGAGRLVPRRGGRPPGGGRPGPGVPADGQAEPPPPPPAGTDGRPLRDDGGRRPPLPASARRLPWGSRRTAARPPGPLRPGHPRADHLDRDRPGGGDAPRRRAGRRRGGRHGRHPPPARLAGGAAEAGGAALPGAHRGPGV
ncbi:MAG: hypothetical protein AVDCRST_MAG06-3009, partial [uncultured Nocardioides sp.]